MSILKEMEQHGAYAQLSNGKVRYEFAGPESGDAQKYLYICLCLSI